MYILDESLYFPPVQDADIEGLLAIGGDLSAERLTLAYKSGIFPWFDDNSPILWWSPDPRFVLFPENFKLSKSLRSRIHKKDYEFTTNTAFSEVIRACQQAYRPEQEGTWITQEMLQAYEELHRRGLAHSAEIWKNGELIGGLYGILLDRVFCGESMFHRESNASKLAFYHYIQQLKEEGIELIDCQVYTDHLASLGAEEISREEFLGYL